MECRQQYNVKFANVQMVVSAVLQSNVLPSVVILQFRVDVVFLVIMVGIFWYN